MRTEKNWQINGFMGRIYKIDIIFIGIWIFNVIFFRTIFFGFCKIIVCWMDLKEAYSKNFFNTECNEIFSTNCILLWIKLNILLTLQLVQFIQKLLFKFRNFTVKHPVKIVQQLIENQQKHKKSWMNKFDINNISFFMLLYNKQKLFTVFHCIYSI